MGPSRGRKMEQETALARSVLQTGQIPRFVGGKVLPDSLRVPNAFSAALPQLGRSDTTVSQALAALHIGIPAISNLPVWCVYRSAISPYFPIALFSLSVRLSLFLSFPLNLSHRLYSRRQPSSFPFPHRARVLFVVHKLYSPRDRRSFFCDSTSGACCEVVPAGGTAAERLFLRIFGTLTKVPRPRVKRILSAMN